MTTPRKLPAILASLSLLAMVTAMFFPALFGGKIVAPLDITKTLLAPWKEDSNGAKPHNHMTIDAVTQYLPYHIFAAQSIKADGYIGWNPYEMGGVSLAGNTMALPGNWTMQLHRFFPFVQAWNLGIEAEFLIAGIGMLVFLRSRSLPWLACLLGAIAYMGNSQFVIWIYHRWALSSFCWMPWVLWSAAHGLSWKNLNTRQLLLPFFLTLALIGGTLQHMVFVVLACGCVVAGGIPRWKSAHKEWPTITGWGLAFVLAAAMAAFTVIPQIIAYFTNIEIGHTRGGLGYPEGISQPFFNLLAIPAQIWPWLMGEPQSCDAWRLLKFSLMDLAYLGTIPMVLAIGGLFVKSMPRQAKWLILAGLLIPLTPLVGPLYHRVQLLFLLGGSWMAAEMLAHFTKNPPTRLIRLSSFTTAGLGGALLIGTLLPITARTSIEKQVIATALHAATSKLSSSQKWIEKRALRWTDSFSLADPETVWVYGLLATGVGGLILVGRSNDRHARWGQLAIIGATSLELCTFFQTWTTFSNPSDLLPKHPAIERVRELARPQRILQGLYDNSSIIDDLAVPNICAAYSIPSVEAYESIQYRSASHALQDADPALRLTLSGVGIAISPSAANPARGTVDWPIADSLHGFTIRKNPQIVAPLTAGRDPVPGQPPAILAALKTATAITPTLQTMNRWTFEVPNGSTWIRIAQNWHSGWRWRSIGQADWQAFGQGTDDACWINQLPSNAKQIEVRFFPRPLWLSVVSIGTLIACLGFLLTFRNFRKPSVG
ncbi:MAG: hypothetical protein WCL19_06760 [Verrucomicrobiota bacterium]